MDECLVSACRVAKSEGEMLCYLLFQELVGDNGCDVEKRVPDPEQLPLTVCGGRQE